MIKERLWQAGLVLLGALVGVAGTWLITNRPDAIHNLQYLEINDAALHKALGENIPELKIIYDDKEIDALSRVSFELANLSDRNMGDFKLYFTVENDIQPLFHSYRSNSEFPIQEITQLDPLTYEFNYLNRSDSIVEGVSYTFQFAEETPPKMTVKVGTQGVGVEKFLPYNTEISSQHSERFAALLLLCSVLVLLISGYVYLRKTILGFGTDYIAQLHRASKAIVALSEEIKKRPR